MNRIKQTIKSLIAMLQDMLLPLAEKSDWLARVYYCFFSRAFGYEQQAILKGKRAYSRRQGIHGRSSALLRRNIHRIEKGLIMRPRRNVFALDYIGETVSAFARINTVDNYDVEEKEWARDVLQAYFSSVDLTHPLLAKCWHDFQAELTSMPGNKIPYKEAERHLHTVTSEQFMALLKARRSTRWFEPRPVPRKTLECAFSMALQAPSACNRQPYQFHVIDNPPLLSKVSRLPGGTAGFSDNIPCLVAVVGDLSYYPHEKDRHVIYIDGALASMQFMLGLETLGLASCPINWPELRKQDKLVSQLLKLPQYQRVVMFIAVGYALPEGEIPYSAKKSVSDVVFYHEPG